MNSYPPGADLTAREKAKGTPMVKVNFKTPCHFRLNNTEVFEFRTGVQEVPEFVANSLFVKAHLKPLPSDTPKWERLHVLTQVQREYLQEQGRLYNEEQLVRWLGQMTDAQQQMFVKNVETWQAEREEAKREALDDAGAVPVNTPPQVEEVDEEEALQAEEDEAEQEEAEDVVEQSKPRAPKKVARRRR